MMYTYKTIHGLISFEDCLKAVKGQDEWFNQSLDPAFNKHIEYLKTKNPYASLPGIMINLKVKILKPETKTIEINYRNDSYGKGIIRQKLLDENLLFDLITSDRIQIIYDINC